MERCKPKWTKLQSEIFRFLCIHTGQEFNQRSISKHLKVSPTTISNLLPELEKEGVITVKKQGKMNLSLIGFNRNNHKAIQLKRVENLKLIYESGLSDYLYDEFPGCTIILFGSYSLGEDAWFGENDSRNSDVDIAIIGTKGKELNLIKYNSCLEKKISVNYYVSWKEVHKNLKDNLLNGIVLSGGIEL